MKLAAEHKRLGSKRILVTKARQAERKLQHHTQRLKAPSKKLELMKRTMESLRTKLDELKSTAKGAIERS